MKLSIIIPAYNEEDRIVSTIEKSLSYLHKQNYSSEIIVVSDGSSDRTASVVENDFNPGKNISLKALEYHPNKGKGYAVRYGMLRGAGEIIMFMDADYSVPIEMLERGMKLIEEGHDIAIASRAVRGSIVASHQNFFRELSAKIYTAIQNFHLGIKYKDTQCGFKMFTSQAAKKLFRISRLNSVIFDPEILWLAKLNDFNVAQFPVRWTHQEDSRIQYDSIGKSLFVFRELFKIKKLYGRPR